MACETAALDYGVARPGLPSKPEIACTARAALLVKGARMKASHAAIFRLNDAAIAGDMTLAERLRWLTFMVALGAFTLMALWACR